jgi:acetyl-CoA carboxylase biotin carboxyl carrier protein
MAGRKGPKPDEKDDKRDKHRPDEARSASDGIVDTVRGLAQLVAEHSLSELVVEIPNATITLRRGGATAVPVPIPMPMPALAAPVQAMPALPGFAAPAHAIAPGAAPAAPPAPAEHDNSHVVTSPFVGTFYRRPNPDSPSYVELNERVDKGQVLCIVEAMKLMNEIEADVAGTVIRILAEDGAPVEYGQALFKIAPA